jgi:hypothetical protein
VNTFKVIHIEVIERLLILPQRTDIQRFKSKNECANVHITVNLVKINRSKIGYPRTNITNDGDYFFILKILLSIITKGNVENRFEIAFLENN